MRLVNTYEHALVAYLCVLLAASPFVLWAQQGLPLNNAWLAGVAVLSLLAMVMSIRGLRANLRATAPLGDRVFCGSAMLVALLPLGGSAVAAYLIAVHGAL